MDKIREALEYAAEWHSDCYYTQEKAKEALALMSESENSDAQDLALELAYGIWEPNTLYEGARNAWLRDAYAIIERCFAERERKAREAEREACAEHIALLNRQYDEMVSAWEDIEGDWHTDEIVTRHKAERSALGYSE